MHRAAATLAAKAFEDDPPLVGTFENARYNAACSAALDDSGRALWRRRAVSWLGAELASLAKRPPRDADFVRGFLRHWKKDPDIAVVRDAIENLPADEQESCRALWRDVDALLAKMR